MLMVLVVAALAIPFVSLSSDQALDTRMQIINEQMRTRHPVEAVVVDKINAPPSRYSGPGSVRVEWREGTQVRSAVVSSPTLGSPGATVTIWLSDAGAVVPPPQTPQAARSVAAARAWVQWIGIVGAAALFAFGSQRLLDRHRAHLWERELLVLAHNDDGWADRHS